MEVKLRTVRALAEAAHQTALASAERQRAAEFEALNTRLRSAMDELETTQSLLLRRNAEIDAAYARIKDLSLTDPLTGLKNRRFLTQVIDADIAQCVRAYRRTEFAGLDAPAYPEYSDIVFYLLDIDHFKAVNDEHGHSAGDAVLVQLRDRLLSATGAEDYCIRWGGEEFLVDARGVERSEAHVLAERLRLAVEPEPFMIGPGLQLTKTVSIGFAAFPPERGAPEATAWMAVVDAADGNLYHAKRSGQNRWMG